MPLDSQTHRLVQQLTRQRRNAFARSRRHESRLSALDASIEENARLREALARLLREHEAARSPSPPPPLSQKSGRHHQTP
ncbi:MAG TPA: hypothetical protein VFN74_23250 [Chloroflexota bacterium]|nr:hypothetical protein [Chloroflexota bacterium]